jgi:hypothetical protein
MAVGILLLVWSIWEMTGWTPDISQTTLVLTILVQGFGLGFLFIPLQVIAFATLPVMLRTDGASLFSLARNIGAAIGVSITSAMLAHNTQALHAEIGASVTPFNRALQDGGVVHQYLNPATHHGAALLDQIINRQAQIIAYMDDYKMMIFTTLPAILLLFLMRRPRRVPRAAADTQAAIDSSGFFSTRGQSQVAAGHATQQCNRVVAVDEQDERRSKPDGTGFLEQRAAIVIRIDAERADQMEEDRPRHDPKRKCCADDPRGRNHHQHRGNDFGRRHRQAERLLIAMDVQPIRQHGKQIY